MARLTWQNVTAPDLTGAADIMNSVGSNWDRAFTNLATTLKDARETQKLNRSAALFPEFAGVKSEAGVDALLGKLPGMIDARDMTPEAQKALLGLRELGMGYDSTRISQANARAAGARAAASAARDAAERAAWTNAGPELLQRAAAAARGEAYLPGEAPDAGYNLGAPVSSGGAAPQGSGVTDGGLSLGAPAPRGDSVYDLTDIMKANPNLSVSKMLELVGTLQDSREGAIAKNDSHISTTLSNERTSLDNNKTSFDNNLVYEAEANKRADQDLARNVLAESTSVEDALQKVREMDLTPEATARLMEVIKAGADEFTSVAPIFDPNQAKSRREAQAVTDRYKLLTDAGLTDGEMGIVKSAADAQAAVAANPAKAADMVAEAAAGATGGDAGKGGNGGDAPAAAGSGVVSSGLKAIPEISDDPVTQDQLVRNMARKYGLPDDIVLEAMRQTAYASDPFTLGELWNPFQRDSKELRIDQNALELQLKSLTPEKLAALTEQYTAAQGNKEDLTGIDTALTKVTSDIISATRPGSKVPQSKVEELLAAKARLEDQKASFTEDRPVPVSRAEQDRRDALAAEKAAANKAAAEAAAARAAAERLAALRPGTDAAVAQVMSDLQAGPAAPVDNSIAAMAERISQGLPAEQQNLPVTGDFRKDADVIYFVINQNLPAGVSMSDLRRMDPKNREAVLGSVVQKLQNDRTIPDDAKQRLYKGIWAVNSNIMNRN